MRYGLWHIAHIILGPCHGLRLPTILWVLSWVFLCNVQSWLGKALCDAVVERLSQGCSMDYQEQSMCITNYLSDKIEIQTSYLFDPAQVESEA